jgi:cytochrome P450
MALPPGPRAPAALNTVRFARRPLTVLREWHARYGDVFTVRMSGFGTGVYVADPAAIRELFTGDQSDLKAGEANSFMEPVLGPHSVLILDGAEHLRQRKLLLPPFQGSRVSSFRDVIRECAEREIAGWRAGQRLVMRERMRALTFEVICRAVFGVTDSGRVESLRAKLGAVIDSSPLFMIVGALRTNLGPLSPGGRFAARLRAADAALLAEIARRREDPALEQRTDVLSLLLRARDEQGRAMSDRELRDELFTMLGAVTRRRRPD